MNKIKNDDSYWWMKHLFLTIYLLLNLNYVKYSKNNPSPGDSLHGSITIFSVPIFFDIILNVFFK